MPTPTASSTLASLLFPPPTHYDLLGSSSSKQQLPTSIPRTSTAHSSVQLPTLEDTVLGVVQAFEPAGAVLGMLSSALHARVVGELGVLSNGGVTEGAEAVGAGQVSQKGRGDSKAGKQKRDSNAVAGSLGEGESLQGVQQVHGLSTLQMHSLLRLARMAAVEAQASSQPHTVTLNNSNTHTTQHTQQAAPQQHQPSQQQQQQQQPHTPQPTLSSTPIPNWLSACLPQLAVHACLRSALQAGAPPDPLSAPSLSHPSSALLQRGSRKRGAQSSGSETQGESDDRLLYEEGTCILLANDLTCAACALFGPCVPLNCTL